MFRIGEFSRIARVSARLLRLYDEIGLLTPAHADPQSGYRYYAVEQLSQLIRVLVLEELGFDLNQVRDVVKSIVGFVERRHVLLLRRNDVKKLLAAEAQRLDAIETRIAELESEGVRTFVDVV